MDESVVEGSVDESGKPVKVVKWDHTFDFQTRGLTKSDLIGLGADPEAEGLTGVEWNPSNGWTVPRDDIPLNDIQLGGLLALEKSFRLVDAD
jgi:hypothetical protein